MSWWQVFLSGLIGSSLPGLFVGLYFSRSLERMKGDLQRDIFKSSKWHERRIDAVIAIYEAFEVHLDFLRRHLYWDGEKGPIDQIHDFPRAVRKNVMFLDDDLAEEILQYQGQLFSFWNDTMLNRAVASDHTREKLDYELPAILPKLRRAINKSMDPQFGNPNPKHSFLKFSEQGRPTPSVS
jgi:hypothetical protein